MLNLPQQIKLYGCLRDWWDGDREHSIQELKPELKIMQKTMVGQYLRKKMDNLRRKRVLTFCNDAIAQSTVGKLDFDELFGVGNDDDIPSNWYCDYHRFDSKQG